MNKYQVVYITSECPGFVSKTIIAKDKQQAIEIFANDNSGAFMQGIYRIFDLPSKGN